MLRIKEEKSIIAKVRNKWVMGKYLKRKKKKVKKGEQKKQVNKIRSKQEILGWQLSGRAPAA